MNFNQNFDEHSRWRSRFSAELHRLAEWLRQHDLLDAAVAEQVDLPPGYSVSWSGQFEFLERAAAQLKLVVPFTLLIIFVLLYLTFRRFDEALLIMTTLPFALVGGVWLLYLLDYDLSIAAAVGFIALAGVAAETGVVMVMATAAVVRRMNQITPRSVLFIFRLQNPVRRIRAGEYTD